MSRKIDKCSFCGRDERVVSQLFQGPEEGIFICDNCVESCHDLLRDTTGSHGYAHQISKNNNLETDGKLFLLHLDRLHTHLIYFLFQRVLRVFQIGRAHV